LKTFKSHAVGIKGKY